MRATSLHFRQLWNLCAILTSLQRTNSISGTSRCPLVFVVSCNIFRLRSYFLIVSALLSSSSSVSVFFSLMCDRCVTYWLLSVLSFGLHGGLKVERLRSVFDSTWKLEFFYNPLPPKGGVILLTFMDCSYSQVCTFSCY